MFIIVIKKIRKMLYDYSYESEKSKCNYLKKDLLIQSWVVLTDLKLASFRIDLFKVIS